MATLRAARQTYKDGMRTTDAEFLRIERTDGEVIRLTALDANVNMTQRVLSDGSTQAIGATATYYSRGSFTASAAASSRGFEPGNLDIDGLLDIASSTTNITVTEEVFPIATAKVSSIANVTHLPSEIDQSLLGLAPSYPRWESWQGMPDHTIPQWIQFDFEIPVRINSIRIERSQATVGDYAHAGISISGDGKRFDELVPRTEYYWSPGSPTPNRSYVTITLPRTVRTRYVRVTFSNATGAGGINLLGVDFYHTITQVSHGTVSRADIENGLYKDAQLYLFRTNYLAPYEDDEKISRGFVSNMELKDKSYTITSRSFSDVLKLKSGRVISPSCDTSLGSFRCGVRLDPVQWSNTVYAMARTQRDASSGSIVRPTTQNGFFYYCTVEGLVGSVEPTWPTNVGDTVVDGGATWKTIRAHKMHNVSLTSVTDRSTFVINSISSFSNDSFTLGEVEFTSGDLDGVRATIKSQTAGTVVLFEELAFLPLAGDTVTITVGCRKRLAEDCVTAFENSINFQGFPFIPGSKVAGKFGGQG